MYESSGRDVRLRRPGERAVWEGLGRLLRAEQQRGERPLGAEAARTKDMTKEQHQRWQRVE